MTNPRIRWTNPSVVRFAEGGDPMDRIREAARQAVAHAFDEGWSGPPFDPVGLAGSRGIEVVPRDDVLEAQTVSASRDRLRIEYNPSRPRGRVRFSIAHEIAHTLFPDCRDEVRHRGATEGGRADAWQLEMLCNLAASEFLLPFADLPDLHGPDLNIGALLHLRRRYDVSAEAVFIRMARGATHDAAAFCASKSGGRWRIDYVVPSDTWNKPPRRGSVLRSSELADYSAVGMTISEEIDWDGQELHVEGVTLPPYQGISGLRLSGMVFPVVEGLAKPDDGPRLTHRLGDATEPVGDGAQIIAHVVNDRAQSWGGGGFSSAVSRRFPEARASYTAWTTEDRTRLRLGNVHFAVADDGTVIASMVAQRGYGEGRTQRLRYDSLGECLRKVAEEARTQGASVHMPRIGTGLAGGVWSVVEYLVRENVVGSGVGTVVYSLPGATVLDAGPRQLGLFGEQ